MLLLALTFEVNRLFIVYCVAAGRSITKYIRVSIEQKPMGTSSGKLGDA